MSKPYMAYWGAQCPVPAEPRRADGLVPVYDLDAGETIYVPLAEARAGMVRYARSLGPGTPACGVWEERALKLAEQHYHSADGLPGHRSGLPCTCTTPLTEKRPVAIRGGPALDPEAERQYREEQADYE